MIDGALVPPVRRVMKRLRLGRPVVSGELRLVHAQIERQAVVFCTDMQNDPIQKSHRKGRFYEAVELDWMKRVFPKGGVFVDIGANVGNHTLYAALILKAGRVIPFEPNPLAYNLLLQNVLVNRLNDVVDLSKLGVGVSDHHAGGFAMEARRKNLGGAKMLAGEGDLEVYPAHELLNGIVPDVVKIDVEGMEMEVLSGLEPLLERCRPMLMVEVDNDREATFFAWAEAQGYGRVATHARYRTNKNHLMADRAQVDRLIEALPPATEPEPAPKLEPTT